MPINPKQLRAAADGKLRLELLDNAMMHPTAIVLAHGAEKYGVRNWRKVGINASTYIGAIRRHVDAMADGQWLDEDSGQPHLAHVVANCDVMLDAEEQGMMLYDHNYSEILEPEPDSAEKDGRTSWHDWISCPTCAIPDNCRGRGRCLQLVCGCSTTPGLYNVAAEWVGPGCRKVPCAMAVHGCPGPVPRP